MAKGKKRITSYAEAAVKAAGKRIGLKPVRVKTRPSNSRSR